METNIVLIGAGSAQFGYGTLGDIFQSKILSGTHIVLHDINDETLAQVEEMGKTFIKEHDLPYTLSATTIRKDALKNADFIIISIEVGDRFLLWDQDWHVPHQYGLRQAFGENGGPGGLFHSLRIIPPILEICEDIEEICPKAHVFNFSNPMSRICTTVNRKYPDLKFVGLCHEIASIKEHLPNLLGVPLEKLSFRAGGLNHFSVLLEAAYKETGKDAYPKIRENAKQYFQNLPGFGDLYRALKEGEKKSAPDQASSQLTTAYPWPERWLFKEILDKFDLLPITTDSHLGEYVQWAKNVADHKGILDFHNFYKEWTLNQTPHIDLNLAERIIPIIEGILTDAGFEEAAVNLPNKGLIDNLPEFIVVEVPAIVDKDGIHGVKLGQLPKGFAGLLCNQVAVHDLTAEAVLSGSRDVALQALLVDPTVDNFHAAEQALDAILELQSDYLGYIK